MRWNYLSKIATIICLTLIIIDHKLFYLWNAVVMLHVALYCFNVGFVSISIHALFLVSILLHRLHISNFFIIFSYYFKVKKVCIRNLLS